MSINKIVVNGKSVEFATSGDSSLKIINGNDNSDFDISDNNGNVLVNFKDGHIQTKNFDSSNVGHMSENLYNAIYGKFSGKVCGIIGDSISTFRGTMPSSYAIYYPQGDVNDVNKMWWKIVCDTLGMIPVNCAWSGSKVTGTASGTTSASAACSDQRILDLSRNGSAPDIVICYISCNDWGNGVAIGDWSTNDSIDITKSSVNTLREAYALMIYKINKQYPNCRVFVCSNLDDTARDKKSGWPSNNSNNISTYEWNNNIREIGEALGASYIDLHACGINYANISNFVVDSGLHPNAAGQKLMASKIISQLIAKY